VKDAFSGYHPVVNFAWFGLVLLFSMIFLHPVLLGISLFCAFAYSVILNGKKAVRFNLLYMLPLLLVLALLNPAFNHAGVTILFYLKSGNPVTLESVLYGITSATLFVSVLLWFSCYNAVMTSDKFLYLFGRVIPALSLILSMVLRFVPRYKGQIRAISDAQKCIGKDASEGNLFQRAKNGIRILSIMTTWALENAIETADSMRSRGYGLEGRTSFSIYRFETRDKLALSVILFLAALVLIGGVAGQNGMAFFPALRFPVLSPLGLLSHLAYLTLCLLPVIIDCSEELKWKSIGSGR
jgi:energy-coupling factor transport system permease protein